MKYSPALFCYTVFLNLGIKMSKCKILLIRSTKQDHTSGPLYTSQVWRELKPCPIDPARSPLFYEVRHLSRMCPEINFQATSGKRGRD